MSVVDIGGKAVGPGQPCLIVAEVGLAHDGSLGMAHAFVDAAWRAGADAVKFQCHLAEETEKDEKWRVAPKWGQDKSRYEYWRRTAFSRDEWWLLKAHTHKRGLMFLCSPFSAGAVELLEPLVPAWKIGSGELLHEPLMEAVNKTGKPVIVSTGMCTLEELAQAYEKRGQDWVILQCTSMYPCPPDLVGLGMLEYLRTSYECPVGLSDHSGTVFAGLGAVALGCDVLEVHVCFSRKQFGFDVEASLTLEELNDLTCGVRFIEAAKAPLFKDVVAQELSGMRELFMDRWKRKGKTHES